ncbi:hypothetical protein [Blastococcus sp. CCUG 61487]|uniref:hypothetical protein n=1 Tax=Blastococcus sp. CCUG 61487 TaxID=1840703 RepID=UPI0010BF87E5|nr:hypothetical protein [Blastococcus sp. CCUG 61487]TKJ33494.1 hypothetical protein A6V29_16005 [Blastococcus sp. CCUG 61487]
MKALSYPEYLEKLTQAADELEVAEGALWEEARRDGQANPAIPLIVRPGTAIEAAVDRVLLARAAVQDVLGRAPGLPG